MTIWKPLMSNLTNVTFIACHVTFAVTFTIVVTGWISIFNSFHIAPTSYKKYYYYSRKIKIELKCYLHILEIQRRLKHKNHISIPKSKDHYRCIFQYCHKFHPLNQTSHNYNQCILLPTPLQRIQYHIDHTCLQ